MARTEARMDFGFWKGTKGLSDQGRLIYAKVMTEPSVTHCGAGALRVSRWAKDLDWDAAKVEAALREVDESRHILIDWDTEEVLIRTFIRNDKVHLKPFVMKSALKTALSVESARLRRVLAEELRKFDMDEARQVAGALVDGLETVSKPSQDPSQTESEPSADGDRLETVLEGCGEEEEVGEPLVGGQVEKKKTSSSSSAQKRGHRIPDGFTVTPEMVTWARENVPAIDGRRETENFVDYWTAASGRNATKRDWTAAWRTWMRGAETRAPRRQQNGFVSSTDQNIMQFLGQPGETNVVPLRGIER